MSYRKMTVEDFKLKLKNGEYQNATGARRGAGKADLSEGDKAACYRAIDAHFGTESASPKAEKKQAVAKKPKAQSKKVEAKRTNGKSEPAEATAKKGPGRGRRRAQQPVTTSLEIDNNALAQVHLANERIGTITQAIDAMKKAKEAYPALNTEHMATTAVNALTDIMQGVHTTLKSNLQLDPHAAELLQRTAAAAQGLPGQPSPIVTQPQNEISQNPQLS